MALGIKWCCNSYGFHYYSICMIVDSLWLYPILGIIGLAILFIGLVKEFEWHRRLD